MSRSYQFRVMVKGHKPERLADICAALQSQWDFDPSDFPLGEEPPPVELDVSGVDNLTGGMADYDMANRLAHAVWAANGAYAEVEVWSTFLDMAPPCDTHRWEEGDYQEWVADGGPASDERDDRVQTEHGVPGPQRAGEDGRNTRQPPG